MKNSEKLLITLNETLRQTGRYFPRDRVTIGHRKSVRTFFSQEISQPCMNNRKVIHTLQKVRQVEGNLNAQKKSTHYTKKDQNYVSKRNTALGELKGISFRCK